MKKQLAHYSISKLFFACESFIDLVFKLNFGFDFDDTPFAVRCNVFDSSNNDKFKELNQIIDLTDRGFKKRSEVESEKNIECKEVSFNKDKRDQIPQQSLEFKISLVQPNSNSLEDEIGNDWGQFDPLD